MIAKRRVAEAALKKSESRLSEAQHIGHIGNWEYDVLKDRLWWSDEVYAIFGLNLHNVTLSIHTFLESVYPDDRKNLEKEMKSGKPDRTDYRIVRPDGDIRFIHEEVRMEKDADGHPLMAWGTAQDITDRKRTEKEIHEARKRAETEKAKSEAIIAGMGDGISIQDTDYKVIYQNKVHNDWLGDHNGEYCYRAYEKHETICKGCPVKLSFKDGRIHTAERSAQTRDGLSYFEITASPLRDPAGNIIAGIEVVRNITERKKAE
jgi:PAS domain S-box-containing protein